MSFFGESLFYGGVIGGVITLVLALVATLALSLYNRRLTAHMDEEYGKSVKKVK